MKAQTSSNGSNGRKTVLFVVLGLVATVLVLATLLFVRASRASGYWQIRAAERSFKVPSDWQKVSTSSDVGWWGVACGDAFDRNGCPFIIGHYKISRTDSGISTVGQDLAKVSGIVLSNESCREADKSKFSQDLPDTAEACQYDANVSNSKLVISIDKKTDGKTYEISIDFQRLTSHL